MPVRAAGEGGRLTLAAHLGEAVLALTLPAGQPGTGSLLVPLSLLEAFEGSGDEVVSLESGQSGGRARWSDRGLPRSVEFDSPEPRDSWPELPGQVAAAPAALLAALHEAGRSTGREPVRFAMDRVQVRGSAGEVNGTDGKQCLMQSGFEFPFTQDLLVPALPIFGSKEFAQEEDVRVGLAEDWLYVAAGLWSVWLKHDPEARFPDVRSAIPKAPGTRFVLTEKDAALLLGDLESWPKNFGSPGGVTLDLDGRVAARARLNQSGEVVERLLPGSEVTGPPARAVLFREHLARALALGFRQFRCASPERPLVAWDDTRTYLTATLDAKDAVPPAGAPKPRSAAAPLADRSPSTAVAPVGQGAPPAIPSPLSLRRSSMPARDSVPPERNGQTEEPGDPLDLLDEAEAVRVLLSEATGRILRLVAALKQHRKERRALASAFSSLKQLHLGR
jgi:hypothetical protein